MVRARDDYEQWRHNAIERRRRYVANPEPNLFSILTPVFNSPPDFLNTLAASIAGQIIGTPDMFEWVVVDNGSSERASLEAIQSIAELPFVRFVAAGRNLGIARGT